MVIHATFIHTVILQDWDLGFLVSSLASCVAEPAVVIHPVVVTFGTFFAEQPSLLIWGVRW
jgi:hypothetical protein